MRPNTRARIANLRARLRTWWYIEVRIRFTACRLWIYKKVLQYVICAHWQVDEDQHGRAMCLECLRVFK